MLPKIVVSGSSDKKLVYDKYDLLDKNVLSFEAVDAKTEELRNWVYNAINIIESRPNLTIIIWQTEKLSPESQAVLLKPMEELSAKTNLLLVVENENGLLPTILSRGVVEKIASDEEVPNEKYWSDIRKCWSSGPSACLAFVDQLDKEEGVMVMEEIMSKLQSSLINETNEKRLFILDLAITTLHELKETNVNKKLLMDNFLLSSWKMIKA